jgi:hypothetical protein
MSLWDDLKRGARHTRHDLQWSVDLRWQLVAVALGFLIAVLVIVAGISAR